MPILGKEPSAWPEELFDDQPVDDQHWVALHVRPRTEKAVARQLRSRNVPFFLPVHESRKVYQRRQVSSYSPLFPGYVFARADEDAKIACAGVKEVVTRLEPDDQQQLCDDLKRIHALLEAGAPLTREERLQPGMPARIVSGPLAGMSGTVVRNKSGVKFVLQVKFIQQAASIELDGSQVEAE
ncbi:MAG TPA: transcription termination/antitermination NusG family protein [Caulifigura sp.]|jgi:transcriptional antiterminator RfaH|nr:transcription termination/antitermination NusG family protein [Caulifigura sp.]